MRRSASRRWEELQSAEAQLDEGEAELQSKQQEWNEGQAQLEAAQAPN